MFHLSLVGELVGNEEKRLGKGGKPVMARSMEDSWESGREASGPRPAPKESRTGMISRAPVASVGGFPL